MPASHSFRRQIPSTQEDSSVTLVPSGPSWRRFGWGALVATAILGLCWHVASLLMAQTNQTLGPQMDAQGKVVRGDQDQKHNVNQALLARDFREPRPDLGTMENVLRWLPHRTDGVVAPLWPWVAARLSSPSQPYRETEVVPQDEVLFAKGKWANVGVVMAFLGALGLVMARSFRPAATAAVLLLGGLGALVPRAVYFQPEPLYYVFFFLTWVCAVKLLFKNDIWMHAVLGLLGGLAYLAKTSVEPLLLGWLAVSGLRFVREGLRRGDPMEERAWNGRQHFIGLIVFAFAWLAVVAPRYVAAEERWGDARFSYPSAWMWMDDFQEGFNWMGKHPNRAALEAIPPEERPSAARYLKTHTAAQAQERLLQGTSEKVGHFLAPKPVKPKKDGSFGGWKVILEQRGLYLGGLGVVALGAALLVWSRRRAVDRVGLELPSGSWAVVLFTGGSALGYGLLYGWYDPIGRGDRFMLSLYLPLVFCLVWASERLMDLALRRRAPRWTAWVYQSALWAVNAAVLWRVVEVLRLPVFAPGTL